MHFDYNCFYVLCLHNWGVGGGGVGWYCYLYYFNVHYFI